ncbi:MAG: DUF1905 domain-containing protein [Prolixibacteraceae bacterium]|nr:DUF1905 domain-containing protein [Prolixibacteraceae bacterium]MBN2773626.1 DUF1905 domain-containing protein [Prolixibacteraceae bacterium]
MSKTWEFKGFLYQFANKGHFIDIPFDGKTEFGTNGPVRVYIWFENFKYRTSLAPKGDGAHWVHVRKEIRDAIGKGDGDTIHVKFILDKDSRDPEMPEDLKWLLENEPEIKSVFNKQSASVKKYLIESVAHAKTDETRINNINKVFEFLNQRKNKS